MIPELGQFALILALVLSAAQAVFGLAGAAYGIVKEPTESVVAEPRTVSPEPLMFPVM